ncbi:MAG: hypothetical protein LBJ14_09150 [Desulfarculales bacterium]|nr:hypothetical protein [Desulfarculales bacterium]
MSGQEIIVGLIVLGAAFYTARRLWLVIRGHDACCRCRGPAGKRKTRRTCCEGAGTSSPRSPGEAN